MLRVRGGVWLTGADLGYDALGIAASGLAERTTPWAALCPIFATNLWLTNSGPSTAIRIDWMNVDPADGNTNISGTGIYVVASGINTGTQVWSLRIADGLGGTSLSTNGLGATLSSQTPLLLSPPYVRFRITNSDAVNAATVTLRAFLGSYVPLGQ